MTEPSPAPKPNVRYDERGVNRDRYAAIAAHGGQRILDVGCGSGAYVLAFAGTRDMHGVDWQPFESWTAAPERFRVSEAQAVASPDQSFDTVTCFETLEHLPDPRAALAELRRLTRGNVIISVPNCQLTHGMQRSGLIHKHWIDRTHVNFWTLDEISALVAEAGFTIRERRLINKINVGHVVMEALGFSGALARFGAKVFGWIQRKRLYMTCLVVADRA